MTAVINAKKFTPSKYQEEVFKALITTNKNIVIEAGPGSGKTTTIVEASKLISYGKSAIFVAFNKKIVNELKNRLPGTVYCVTMHSVGRASIFASYPGANSLQKSKQINYLEPLCEKEGRPQKEKWTMVYQLDRVMQLARATMTPPRREAIEAFCENYAIDLSDEMISILIRAMHRLYEYNDDPDRYNVVIDFTDMVEMCVRNKDIRMPQYDYVFIDEAQDMSQLDQLFLNRLVRPVTGRMIIVGDPKQAIYGFRGAAPDSFERFTKKPNTIVLPLSICYRSTKAIVRNAQNIYPNVEINEDAEEGVEPRDAEMHEVQEGDMVLCRNNFPLVQMFFQLVDLGKKAFILGKEIEQGLLLLLSRFNSYADTKDIYPELDKILDDKRDELIRKGISNPMKHPKYGAVLEKVQILKLLCGKMETVLDVVTFIETTFEDEEREGVQLMSIHKSKGLECDRVFVIDTFDGTPLIPNKYAVTGEQLRQERNLLFVSRTRAKKELFYLHLQSLK